MREVGNLCHGVAEFQRRWVMSDMSDKAEFGAFVISWPLTVVLTALILVQGCLRLEAIRAECGWYSYFGNQKYGYTDKPDAPEEVNGE